MRRRPGVEEKQGLKTMQFTEQLTSIQEIETIEAFRQHNNIQPVEFDDRLGLFLTLTIGGLCLASFFYWLIMIL